MESKYAPFLIPTLNRHSHFKNCIESLLKCDQVEQTDIFIALDYPLTEKHYEGYNKILEYLSSPVFESFKSLTVFKRAENLGAIENIRQAREVIYKEYDRLIFSEDDNVFSTDFLSFINEGLEVYKDREDIFSINGYHFPIELNHYDKDVYLFDGMSAWGYGTWKHKWEQVKFDISLLEEFLKDKEQLKHFNKPRLLSRIRRIVETRKMTGDTFIGYYQHVNKMYSVFPTISRVRNLGHDGTGIHGGNSEKVRKIYADQKISEGEPITFLPDLEPNFKLIKKLNNNINPPLYKLILKNPSIILEQLKKKLS
ncbi:hypothetical protein [Ulvibacter litoralis]|uniref:Glycosyl transferase family 2 n=1 Tax=Ulvibacter litoralis TaxID=227084 RepID=A0A1G7HP18_9FLAO|nr:hypothetical protein [Ulvibacter litoralis]GHC58412.1 hypothetical protein GCM10008083_23970 [Ulvibacter litoralis]SDF01749.1 hypothetical protein SAMN05421855_104186 [Ulvibacter litoralis]